nr:hypothetical protein [Tanacetum cinerariifolium]
MVQYEAFACRYGKGDVVLRDSYQPITREPSSPNSYSPGTTTPQNHHSRTSSSGGCSNCKHLLAKIKVLEEAVEMHMHPEQHPCNSTALLHEFYNDMDNLGLE